MQRQTISTTFCHAKLLALLCMMLLMSITSAGQKKVIIACDWDFAPYEFLNSDGRPDGYNIELLDAILTRMNVPHEFLMKTRRQNIGVFMSRQADLTVDYRDRYKNMSCYRTVSPMGFYRVVATRNINTPSINSTRQLKGRGTIVFNNTNDSIAFMLLGSMADSLDNIDFQSPRTALSGVSEGVYQYFIWGEQTTKWKIKEYNISNVTYDKLLNLKANEIHIVGYDKQLIDEIDSQYARMVQSGEIDQLQDKWFNPESSGKTASPIALYITLAVVALTVVIFIIYRIARKKVRDALRHNAEMEEMMHQALNMSNFAVMIIDLQKGRVFNQHGHVLPDEGVTMQELIDYIHPEDRHIILERREKRNAGRQQTKPFAMRWNMGTADQPRWVDVMGYSYPEFGKHHKPVSVVIASREITEEKMKEQAERDMASHYVKMFESTHLAMSFYDKEGNLLDMNEKMKELCCISDDEMGFFRQTKIFDLDLVKGDFDPHATEDLHVCQHMYYPQLGIDKYIEVRFCPGVMKDGEVVYYIVTARDITEERNMYLELRSQSKALEEAGKSNRAYERELRTLLENCNMYVWHVDFKTKIISFSRSLNKVDFTRTLDEHLKSISIEEQQKAYDSLPGLQQLKGTFNVVHRFMYTPIDDHPCWYATSGMPLTNSTGEVTGLFGIVRNINTLMEAQERLKEETARAENSAMLKATFLANMTHEIRTPLNAIVGFSDVLQMVDAPEERKEFIRIIHNNCDMLMRLINDIFEASTMDIKPLEIVAREVDFAAEFNVVSQSLSQRVQEPGVEYIVDSPMDSFRTVLDMGRMQQVITNFVTNAVKYTHQGHIRVGWKYIAAPLSSSEGGTNAGKPGNMSNEAPTGAVGGAFGIYMYCEDTGTGIPKEKQKKVFDRFVKLNDFVQGTGLGLSICKSIAERSGGSIGVISEGDGQGSTFWIWVPCHEVKSVG